MSFSSKSNDSDNMVGDESRRSVILERRRFLSISASAVAAIIAELWTPAIARQLIDAESSLSWSDLIKQAILLAKRVTSCNSSDEEAYLVDLEKLVIGSADPPTAYFNLAKSVAKYESEKRFPLVVSQFRMAPNAVIPFHDHRDYNGLLMVTNGTLRVRSYEIVDANQQPLEGGLFRIRETSDVVLSKRDSSTLTRTRDNIHQLEAGHEGARFVDFFTLFERNAYSKYLNVQKPIGESSNKFYDAHWATDVSSP